MKKRYGTPRTKPGQIKVQRGKLDAAIDICIYYGEGVPRCDRALIFNKLGSGSSYREKSFFEELEARGYDLDTLRFSIEKKALNN